MSTLPTEPESEALDDRDRRELLRIARATLREHLATGYLPPGSPHRKSLLRNCGAFVTIKIAGPLVFDPIMEPADRLSDARLEERLQSLAREAGMDEVRIVVNRDTAKSGAIWADVRGVGPGVRIRLSEALASSGEGQLLFAVAHEIGHHVLGHLWQDTALALAILVGDDGGDDHRALDHFLVVGVDAQEGEA